MGASVATPINAMWRMILNMASGATSTQFIREALVNSFEAASTKVRVAEELWSDGGRKFTVIDNGCGMGRDELVDLLGRFAVSGKGKNVTVGQKDSNFGIGARVAAFRDNPAGLVYRSWQRGRGFEITLSPIDRCLVPYDDGSLTRRLRSSEKPQPIGSHGTQVIFLGAGTGDHTVLGPKGVDAGPRWIVQAVNKRFYELPANVHLSVIEPTSTRSKSRPRQPIGQAAFNTTTPGATRLGPYPIGNADVDVWTFVHDQRNRAHGGAANPGHIAIEHRGELYEMLLRDQAKSLLRSFGFNYASGNIAMVVRPHNVTSDILRGGLVFTEKNETVVVAPWARWATEFSAHMPAELAAFERKERARTLTSSQSDDGAAKWLNSQLKWLQGFVRTTTQKAASGLSADQAGNHVGEAVELTSDKPVPPDDRSDSNDPKGRKSHNGSRTRSVFGLKPPLISWCSPEDDDDVLAGACAAYDPARNLIRINSGDDLIGHIFEKMTGRYPNHQELAHEHTKKWLERVLSSGTMTVVAKASSMGLDVDVIADQLTPLSMAGMLNVNQIEWNAAKQLSRQVGRTVT